MRHAKSDWDADYGADNERPLNDRGVRSARIMGRLLTAEDVAPDLVMTSTAVRARSTAELAKEAGSWTAEIVLEPRLYGTNSDTAIQVAAAAPPVTRLMLVGHQPAWSILVSALTGERVEMRTATVVFIDFELDDWAGLAPASGSVGAVYQPRDLFGGEFDRD